MPIFHVAIPAMQSPGVISCRYRDPPLLFKKFGEDGRTVLYHYAFFRIGKRTMATLAMHPIELGKPVPPDTSHVRFP